MRLSRFKTEASSELDGAWAADLVEGVEAAGLSAGVEVVVEHLRGLAELGRGHGVDRVAEVRVVEDVEELQAKFFGVAKLAAQGDGPQRRRGTSFAER
jgi:hypothetical protein